MGHPVLLALTVPRSGTTLLHTWFRSALGHRVRSEHEPIQHAARLRRLFRCFDGALRDEALRDPAIGALVRDLARDAETRPVAVFGNTLSHLAPVFRAVLGDRLRLLHLHRNPVTTSASIFVKTRPEWWTRSTPYAQDPYGLRISPFDPRAAFPAYRARWDSLSLFERILYQWLERHAYALEAAERLAVPVVSLRSEDLFADPAAAVRAIAGLLEVDVPASHRAPDARRNESWTRNRERRPLGEEWRSYADHPEVAALADRLGHVLDVVALDRAMERYRLPGGILPWVRHRTGYWDRRERVARWVRGRGWSGDAAPGRAGLPPRSLPAALRETLLPQRRR